MARYTYSVKVEENNKSKTHTFYNTADFNMFVAKMRFHKAQTPLNDIILTLYKGCDIIYILY
jgi:hypothetical protein